MPAEPRACLVVADDDADDRLLIEEALSDAGVSRTVHFVEDGEQLLALLGDGVTNGSRALRPALILLDLNMPRMDGREALRAIRAHEVHRTVPVVVLTTSGAQEDVAQSYALGANAFVCKPTRFADLVELMRQLDRWWFGTVELPPRM